MSPKFYRRVSLLAVALSLAWFISVPGYEPSLALIAAIVTALTQYRNVEVTNFDEILSELALPSKQYTISPELIRFVREFFS